MQLFKRAEENNENRLEIKFGEEILVPGMDLRVTFAAVSEDSRCPTGADCFWAGNAKLEFKVGTAGEETIIELNTGLEPGAAHYASYFIELKSLEPYPAVDSPVSKDDYAAVLIISERAPSALL